MGEVGVSGSEGREGVEENVGEVKGGRRNVVTG